MKLDANTIAVLKNFSKINNSIFIKQGNVLRTISPIKTIVGKAAIAVSFEQDFAIYSLDRFLSSLSLFNDPELTFEDKYVTISDENKNIKYVYAEEALLTKAPEKELILPSKEVELEITNEEMKNVEKALSVLNVPEIVVHGDGQHIYLQALDTKNPSGDVYSLKIGNTEKKFSAIFKPENIKLLPDTYNVTISAKGISLWKSPNVEYFIAVESTSTF